MSKKKKKRRKRSIEEVLLKEKFGRRGCRLIQYEIVEEPIGIAEMPDEIVEVLEELQFLIFQMPDKAIPQIEDWIEKYPENPKLYNFLAVAHDRAGNYEKAEELSIEIIKRFPDYLFAKINYAQFCLKNDEIDKIPSIFNNKFDLQMLYPRRNKFHITEFSGFMGIMGIYFFKKGDKEQAKYYYDLLKQIAPKYPLTKQLKRLLHPPIWIRLIKLIKAFFFIED
jgi:tetratricopeptide (TPR) repeat protein